jgi:hypothetical protein
MWHSDSVNKWAIEALVSRHRIRIAIKDKTRRQPQFSLSQASDPIKLRNARSVIYSLDRMCAALVSMWDRRIANIPQTGGSEDTAPIFID